MQINPRLKTKYGEQVGVEIFVDTPDLIGNDSTFLSTDVASAVSSFTVENGLMFGVGEYAVVGMVGSIKTEIVRIHTVTAPTASAITLNAATSFAHSRGDRFILIPYNQIVIQRSTDGGSTYSDLATVDIRVDSPVTFYNDTGGLSTYYYRVKFKNSASSNTSQVSDGVLATGYAENSAGEVIHQALGNMGETIDGTIFTKEFLFQALQEGRQEIDQHPKVEKWSFRNAFDYNAGQLIPGQYRIALPSDYREEETDKSLMSVRIGRDRYPLNRVDKIAMNRNYEGVAITTLNGALLTSDTSITLTASGDFEESGDVYIAAATVAGTLDVVAYTANNEATNVISGVTGIVAAGHATGKMVWQGATFGKPSEYAVYDGYIVFDVPFSDDIAGQIVWIDYYKELTRITSEATTLDENFFSIYIPYMRYRMKLRKNPSMDVRNDIDYQKWIELRDAQVDKHYIGQDARINIDI